jgi:glycine hydroxymethyltransferase
MIDRELERILQKEGKRQEETLDLIASENFSSPEVRHFLGSVLTNKYSEGYPEKRYYPGNALADEAEKLAQRRALELFGLNSKKWSVNVQPYSGSPANLAIYLALLEPGGKIMGMRLADGGHLTHGQVVSASGRIWKSVLYGVDARTGRLNYEEIGRIARESKPKVIVCGFTAYPRKVDFRKFRAIADSVGAYLVADISHIAGLVAGGVHPSPFPYAHAVMTTTHKTLRGPRGAVVFSRREKMKEGDLLISEAIDKAVFPGLQGGPHDNETAAKAQAFYEASRPEFKEYAAQVVRNAKALETELKNLGFDLASGGTDTHLLLLDVRKLGLNGLDAEKLLEKAGIIANRNSLPGDSSPFKPSGVRLGTPALTTRGLKEREMKTVAALIRSALLGEKSARGEVLKLCKKFPAKKLLREY